MPQPASRMPLSSFRSTIAVRAFRHVDCLLNNLNFSNAESQLMKKLITAVLAATLTIGASLAFAGQPETRTVAALYQDKTALAGKEVQVKGKVVKVNNGIMGRNFVHVQDGTGDQSSNNLIITSKQTAAVGDAVTITGKVVLNRDFGSGYSYPLLLEESTIAK
jgi:hypothetical protein